MRSPVSKNPALLEINTAVFLKRMRTLYRQDIDLGTIPKEQWQDLRHKGFDLLWCMGVWERSPGSKISALGDTGLLQAYERALPGWNEDDVTGSPYAVHSYLPDPTFGTQEDLRTLKAGLNEAGIGLVLDFVPNHLALDHLWTLTCPENFIRGTRHNLRNNPDMFFQTKQGDILAHGKDPNFPSWKDTAQINYFSPSARDALIDEMLRIARSADGMRCDMAMLVLNSVFEQTWGAFLDGAPRPTEEFWSEAISRVKSRYPSFIFIAEAYWDLEWKLQQLGFDYTYDKKLYDLLQKTQAQQIQEHLWAEPSYQSSSVRFIENHDEPRAAAAFGRDRSTAAAIVAATVPGMHFFHDGQMEGSTIRQPVQLCRQRQEETDRRIYRFYDRLLGYTRHRLLRSGDWMLLNPAPAWEGNPTYRSLLSWIWHRDGEFRLVIVNYSPDHTQGRLYLPKALIRKTTMVFHDMLSDASYERQPSDLVQSGLYIELGPWQAHLFHIA